MTRSGWIVALAGAAFAAPAPGQSSDASRSLDAARAKQVRAVRLERGTVKVDGRLDDDAWLKARWVSDFTQKMPHDGAPPTDSLGLALLYDGDAI